MTGDLSTPGSAEPSTTVVIPTVGRPSLVALLDALAGGTRPVDCAVLVVDDRSRAADDLAARLEYLRPWLPGLRVLRSGGGGPARARNLGWRHARTEWVSFLDDDVLPDADWYDALLRDLGVACPGVAGSQGVVRVPMPHGRRPTDWERTTSGLATSTWITADLSYRRAALAAVGGFDERFPRAYREDADLGLRVTGTQGDIVHGVRRVTHPVRPADDWVSVRQQAGNADDFLMSRLHGPDWRERCQAPTGRRRRHVATVAAGLVAAAAALTGRRRAAWLGALAWSASTAEFAWSRIAPGPRDRGELRRMVLTSALIPFVATYHSVAGAWRHRQAEPWHGAPDLVLVDRDGTIVHDVPYNGDPERVVAVDGARDALDRLRAAGIRVGVVTNQSGVGTGRISPEQLEAVNARVEQLLGPFDVWAVCPHAADDGCACRKPAPGLVKEACQATGVDPRHCLVIGDIGSDIEAAWAAGAEAILVPTSQTRPEEIRFAGRVALSLPAAVDEILGAAR